MTKPSSRSLKKMRAAASSKKKETALSVAPEQPQNPQCSDEHKQLSEENAGREIGIVKKPKKRKSKKKKKKKKISEQLQILQSGEASEQVPSVNPPGIEINPEDAERKIESVETLKTIPEQAEIMQSGDEHKQLSSVIPSELEIKPKDAERATETVEHGLSKKKLNKLIRDRLIQRINEFCASSDQEYTFEENLPKNLRAAVHMHSRVMNIYSKSSGQGAKRRVRVYKPKNNKSSNIVKDAPSFLKLSDESKEVLRNLFMQYPPGQDERIQIKSDCCSTMNKSFRYQWDDFFCKPSMNRVEIAKKVEALSLKRKNDPHLAKINEQRAMLPITSSRDAIVSEIECNQVVLISGETGCGKTTQVPQFLLDKMWEAGQACKILCTQPRRISATSVAERISQERGEVIGETVGYKIRLESQGGRNSSLVFCTNGVLLKLLVSDGHAGSNPGPSTAATSSCLSQITHIVVDEIHERDHYSDFMLAILRDLLPRYPQLRLVLMSATMDAERFSQYFGDCPVIKVPGFTYPVTSFYLEDIISILKSAGRNHINATLPSSSVEQLELTNEHKLALDEAIDLAWSNDDFEPLLELISFEEKSNRLNYQHTRTGVSPLMVFSAKGRVGDMCMLLSLGADCHLKGQDGSTALDWAKRANQTEAADAISRHIENGSSNSNGNSELVDKYLSSVNPELIGAIHMDQLLLKICTDSDHGAILVFLAGWDDISMARDRLLRNQFFQNPSKFQILPLHSMVPPDEQKKVFNRPPTGCRKIILSTNIAETSVTIDDVVYVIDSGRMKEKGYDPSSNVSTLESSWVSKASVKQRAGRAGRCQPGFCYHLYSKLKAVSFSEFSIPEIKRMPLEELCLQVKLLDPNYDIVEFLNKTLDPPVHEAIRNAVAVLKEIGALTNDENLTKLGKQFGCLPVHPLTSKMLFFAILCNCLDPALTLACATYFRDPFTLPMQPEQKKKAADAKAELASLYCGNSDQLAVVAAFECWRNLKQKGRQSDFCSQYFISFGTMNMLSRMRKQLLRELELNGYIPNGISMYNQNARDPGILEAVLVAGLYPNVGRVCKAINSYGYSMETASGDKVRVHQHSINSFLPLKMSRSSALAVYGEINKGDWRIHVKKCSIIGYLPLVLLASEIAVSPTEDNGDSVMSSADKPVFLIVDRWLSLNSTALEVAQIYCLRERLSSAFLLKATEPKNSRFPPALAASVDAATRILSHEGRSEKLPSQLVDTPKSSEVGKATYQAPSKFLQNLFYQASEDDSQGVSPNSSTGKQFKNRPSWGNSQGVPHNVNRPSWGNSQGVPHNVNRSSPVTGRSVSQWKKSPKSSKGKIAMDRTSVGNSQRVAPNVNRSGHVIGSSVTQGTVSRGVAQNVNQSGHVVGRSVVSQGTVQGTQPWNQSRPSSAPTQFPVSQRIVSGNRSWNHSVPFHPRPRSSQWIQPTPTHIQSSPTVQQPVAAQTVAAPVSLSGYGSSLYGPYGPRGRPGKRSRSDR